MMPTRAVTAGASLSLTGRFAVQGHQAQRGLTLWADSVNRRGGLRIGTSVAPRPVRLLVHDDASRRAAAADHTARICADDRVDVLFSPYSSVLALAAAEVAHLHGRTLWNHGGSSDAIAQRGLQRIVNLLTPASQYAGPVLRWAVSGATRRQAQANALYAPHAGPQTLVLLRGAGGTFPQAIAEGARAEAARLGLSTVLDATYPATDDGWPSLVGHIRDVQPDIIVGAGTTEADIRLAQELRRQQAMAPVTALVATPIGAFRAALGPAADGFCGPSQWEPTVTDSPTLGPTSAQFASDFRRRFGQDADYPAAQAFAAGLIAAHCIEQAGSLADAAVWEVARSLDLTTCYGRFRLDSASGQQVGHTMFVVEWQHGRKVCVWPPDIMTTPTSGRA